MKLAPATIVALIAACLIGAVSQAQTGPLPAFEAAAIKLRPPGAPGGHGFKSFPGGRVEISCVSVKGLVAYAFDVEFSQVSGGPSWASSDCFDISAVPPESSVSRTQTSRSPFTPTAEQRLMIQSLLAERFGIKYHRATIEGPAFLLSRGKGELHLLPPADKDAPPVGMLAGRGAVYDGEARGRNITMAQFARVLSAWMSRLVIDQTGIAGAYDFRVLPWDPENTDIDAAAFGAMERLGLKLTASKAPISMIVIDSVSQPTAN